MLLRGEKQGMKEGKSTVINVSGADAMTKRFEVERSRFGVRTPLRLLGRCVGIRYVVLRSRLYDLIN